MALSLARITILLGAGIAGSVIAKEGRLPDVSGIFSGALKVAMSQFKSHDSAPTVKKPPNDALMDQVNILRQELQVLGRDRSVTIVNASGTGGRKYVTVIVIVVVGYGYIRWKGWKLPDMMFATKRGLSDACTSIGNQLGKVYESIEDAKKMLNGRINRLDKRIDESAALSESTREEISVIRREADTISGDFKSVHFAVHVLESKLREIEWNQDETNKGVTELCQHAWNWENNSRTPEYIQALSSSSSLPAIEPPPVSPSSRGAQSGSSRLFLEPPPDTPSRTGSLPPTVSTDPQSPPSSAGSYQSSQSSERNFSNSTGLSGLKWSSISGFLSRTRSATGAVVQQTRTSSS